MAKTLSNSGIATGQTIEASEVSQSIDAFTGADAYDITISGSLTVTGSISVSGSIVNDLTSSNAVTASHALNLSSPTLDAVTTAGNTTANAISTGAVTATSANIGSGLNANSINSTTNIAAGGFISASGNLYAATADNDSTTYKTVVVNPLTGKFYRTGSYAGGGGAGSVGTLNQVTSLGSTTANDISTGAITADGAISSTGQISASGNLFANVEDNGTTTFKTVVYDPATGKFYRTGSFSSALTSEGGKYDVGDGEIVFDDGTGNEGAGLKGDGTDTILIEKADGTGGKLDVGGSDGTGVVIIGKGGAVQGETTKGKISPVLDSGIQEDGHFQILKNDGTTGKISANIKAGTNTTIIDDNIQSTGFLELTGSIYSKSNITSSGIIKASGSLSKAVYIGGAGSHITASGDISSSGKISSLSSFTQFSTSSILELRGGLLSIKNAGVQSQALFYCESNNAHFTAIKAQPHSLYVGGNVTTLLPAYNLDFSKPDFQANITSSGNISSSGYISASHFVGNGSGLTGITVNTSTLQAVTDAGSSTTQPLSTANITSTGDIVANTLNLKSSTSATGFKLYDNPAIPGELNLLQSDGSSFDKFYIKADEVETPGLLNAKGSVQLGDSVNLTDTITVTGHITSSGNISSSGNIFGDRMVASNYVVAPSLDIGTGTTEIDSIVISLPNLPTSDPGIAGRVYRDTEGNLFVSV